MSDLIERNFKDLNFYCNMIQLFQLKSSRNQFVSYTQPQGNKDKFSRLYLQKTLENVSCTNLSYLKLKRNKLKELRNIKRNRKIFLSKYPKEYVIFLFKWSYQVFLKIFKFVLAFFFFFFLAGCFMFAIESCLK